MILLVDLCFEKNSLSKYEFVLPIEDTLKHAGAKCDILHYTEICNDKLERCDKIILCGTALKNNAFAMNLKSFSWINGFAKPILGICAGMQVIAYVYGGSIIASKSIGLETIEIIRETYLFGVPRKIEGYHLHSCGVTLPREFELLAGTKNKAEAFKHHSQPIYGIIFHPEVRNKWILERFIKI